MASNETQKDSENAGLSPISPWSPFFADFGTNGCVVDVNLRLEFLNTCEMVKGKKEHVRRGVLAGWWDARHHNLPRPLPHLIKLSSNGNDGSKPLLKSLHRQVVCLFFFICVLPHSCASCAIRSLFRDNFWVTGRCFYVMGSLVEHFSSFIYFYSIFF